MGGGGIVSQPKRFYISLKTVTWTPIGTATDVKKIFKHYIFRYISMLNFEPLSRHRYRSGDQCF